MRKLCKGLTAIVILALMLQLAALTAAGAETEYYATSGKAATWIADQTTDSDGRTCTYFYAVSAAGGSVTLYQTSGLMHWVWDSGLTHDEADREAYATFRVNYKATGDLYWKEGTSGAVWDSEKYVIDFDKANEYIIKIESSPDSADNKYAKRGYYIAGINLWSADKWVMVPTWIALPNDRCTISSESSKTATVVIQYKTRSGDLLRSETRTLQSGINTVKPDYNDNQYRYAGTAEGTNKDSYTVTVSNGKANKSTLVFYYEPVSIRVEILYVCNDETLASSEKALNPGRNTVYSEYQTLTLGNASYKLLGSDKRMVTVFSNGTYSPDPVVFFFEKTTPDVSPSATIWIDYVCEDGTRLTGTEQTFNPGTYIIIPDFTKTTINGAEYNLVGNRQYTLIVGSDGTPNVTEIVFIYHKTVSGSSLDQTAVICKSPIYPRPGPGIGKNEYNYEVLGQTVTVHSRATSGSKWWICFSGDLRCEGKVFSIDHMWISESYLDENSYDLFSLPIDPQYQ